MLPKPQDHESEIYDVNIEIEQGAFASQRVNKCDMYDNETGDHEPTPLQSVECIAHSNQHAVNSTNAHLMRNN